MVRIFRACLTEPWEDSVDHPDADCAAGCAVQSLYKISQCPMPICPRHGALHCGHSVRQLRPNASAPLPSMIQSTIVLLMIGSGTSGARLHAGQGHRSISENNAAHTKQHRRQIAQLYATEVSPHTRGPTYMYN